MALVLPTIIKSIFEPELVKIIEENGNSKSIKTGEVLIQMGQAIRFIPILISGTIKIIRTDEEGKGIFLYYIFPTESCAMTITCCLDNTLSEIKAIAEEEVEAIILHAELVNNWINKFPSWRSFVMKNIRSKYNELLKAIDEIAFKSLDIRLTNYLKAKSKALTSTLLNISHEKIANDLGTSRVVISRLLKQLEKENKILLYRQQIKLLSNL